MNKIDKLDKKWELKLLAKPQDQDKCRQKSQAEEKSKAQNRSLSMMGF